MFFFLICIRLNTTTIVKDITLSVTLFELRLFVSLTTKHLRSLFLDVLDMYTN